MDEILASIRRIIESGDEVSGSPRNDAPHSPLGETVDVSLPSAATSPVSLPRFDVQYLPPNDGRASRNLDEDLREIEAVEFDEDAGEPEAASETEPEPHRDDREKPWIAGSAQAPEPDVDSAWNAVHDQPAFAVPPAGNENTVPDAEQGEAAGAERAMPSRNFSFEFDDEAFEAALRSDTWHAALEAPQLSEAPRAAAVPDLPPPARAAMPESVIDGASALLSAQAGDQVAAAFDDLTRAIRDGQMRSMEEMAREMMRPMLQEWLDDNLPRIVERLVRDEIERIARGPRR